MLLRGHDFIGALHDALTPFDDDNDEIKVALDLCTGTGKWYERLIVSLVPDGFILKLSRVDDMAEEFPNVRFHGVDIGMV
jgi:hypothetical protein